MFKLTASTDPKSVMLEGHPDTEITKIKARPAYSFAKPGQVYVSTQAETRVYDEDGTQASDDAPARPRIVQRFILDASKPIGVGLIHENATRTAQAELDGRGYHIVRRELPPVGNEPEVFVIARADGSSEMRVSPVTGQTLNRGGVGSNLQFFNVPDVTTKNETLKLDGTLVTLKVTHTDGVLSNIEWIA